MQTGNKNLLERHVCHLKNLGVNWKQSPKALMISHLFLQDPRGTL